MDDISSNDTAQSGTNPQHADSAAATSSRISAREGVLPVAGALQLHHGGELNAVRLAWRITGPENAPIVVALGGISGHRRVFSDDARLPGWWEGIAGAGLALPAEQLRILAFDYLGGSGDSTSPRDGAAFPSVSTYDQAKCLALLLEHLEVDRLRAIVGASYGGMVALAFAERYRDRVAELVLISAADRAHPMATAWRSVQRRIIRLGLNADRSVEGLELARALAMATYRSADEFAARFESTPLKRDGRFIFPVEDYLMARGQDYARRYQPDGFLTMSESIDLHHIDASRVHVPVTAIAVREDQLVPISDIRAMCAKLPHARLHEISSIFGHDAFLKEMSILKSLFAATLELRP